MADDQRTPPPLEVLYDEDFYVWTQDQAAAMLAAGKSGALPSTIDWERLADEVGDLGKRDSRECMSRVRQILIHLWKLKATSHDAPKGHWRSEIVIQRADLAGVLTASLRRLVKDRLDDLHRQAIDAATRSLEVDEPFAPPPDASLRWTLEQILGEEDDPLA